MRLQLADILGAVAVTTFWLGAITCDCEIIILPAVCWGIAAAMGLGWYWESGARSRDRKERR